MVKNLDIKWTFTNGEGAALEGEPVKVDVQTRRMAHLITIRPLVEDRCYRLYTYGTWAGVKAKRLNLDPNRLGPIDPVDRPDRLNWPSSPRRGSYPHRPLHRPSMKSNPA